MAKRRTPDDPFTYPDPSAPRGDVRARAVMETRVFKSGNSYAVRLPKALYTGGEDPVYVRKLDDGRLVITPKRKRRWPSGFFDAFRALPDDFAAPARPRSRASDERRAASRFRDPS